MNLLEEYHNSFDSSVEPATIDVVDEVVEGDKITIEDDTEDNVLSAIARFYANSCNLSAQSHSTPPGQ